MARRTTLAVVSFACLMSIVVATPVASEEVAAPTIIPAETLKWNPTPFPDVTAAVISGNPAGGGIYAIFAKYRAGGRSAPHTHPDQRVVTVISGTYYAGAGTEYDEFQAKAAWTGNDHHRSCQLTALCLGERRRNHSTGNRYWAEWDQRFAKGGGKVAAQGSSRLLDWYAGLAQRSRKPLHVGARGRLSRQPRDRSLMPTGKSWSNHFGFWPEADTLGFLKPSRSPIPTAVTLIPGLFRLY